MEMIYAYKDRAPMFDNSHVTVADGDERIGLVHPLRRGSIEDLDWNDEWLAILVEHNWRVKDGRTYLVIYSMPDLVETARVEVLKYAREVEIVSGADLVAVHSSLSVVEIYRLPDLTEAWRDLPSFCVNAQGDIRRRGAGSHADIETSIDLGFPLFCRDDGTVFGTVRCHNTYRNETPHPVGLMEVRFDNRQLNPSILGNPQESSPQLIATIPNRQLFNRYGMVMDLIAPSPCGRMIMRFGMIPIYKGLLEQDESHAWHRFGLELDLLLTEDLSLHKRLELGDVAVSCPIDDSDAIIAKMRTRQNWLETESIWPSGELPEELWSGPSFPDFRDMGAFWPGHSEAIYFQSNGCLRRIPLDGPAGPWIVSHPNSKHPILDGLHLDQRNTDSDRTSAKTGVRSISARSLHEEGNRLLIFESDSVREVTLDDPDLVILGEDNHRRYKPEPLQPNDVAGDLPCLTTLKSWRSEDVESGLSDLMDRLKTEFGQLITHQLEPYFATPDGLMNEKEFFDELEEKSIEVASVVRRYVDTYLTAAKENDHEPYDTEVPGTITSALDYLVAREDATDLLLRYVRQSDRDHSYHVRDVLLRQAVETAWEKGLVEAPHYAVTEATAWIYSGSGFGDSTFKELGVLEKCRSRLSPVEFVRLLDSVADEFGDEVDTEGLYADCLEGLMLKWSPWALRTKWLLTRS